MVFEHIEKLKQEYTDKYVVVDAELPELSRFANLTGTVKTVNMNGRALVQFDGYNNIGWYDIDIDFLRVVDAPVAKKEPPKARPTAAKKAAKAPAKPAAGKATGGKMSVDDILAAARSGGGGAAPAKKTPAAGGGEKMSVEDILAAARGKGTAAKQPAPPVAPAPKKAAGAKDMSVADILAAARGNASAASSAPAPAAEPTAAEGAPVSGATEMSVADVLAAARRPKSQEAPADVSSLLEAGRTKKGAAADTPPPGKSAPAKAQPALDPTSMSVAEMLAAARAEKSGGGPAATTPEPAAAAPAQQSTEDVAAEPPAQGGEIPTDVPGILSYCRRVDAQ